MENTIRLQAAPADKKVTPVINTLRVAQKADELQLLKSAWGVDNGRREKE